jgi:hypothetical protein
VMHALFADGDPAAAVQPAAALEKAVGGPLGDNCCLDRFAAGEYALSAGQFPMARRALADLERRGSRQPDKDFGAKLAQGYAAILSAQMAARERSSRAAEQLRTLDSTLDDPSADSDWMLTVGNLIAARLHADRREYREALGAIRRRDRNRLRPIYVTYHLEEGHIAAAAGDTTGAIAAYQRYLRIRKDAEPRLQPEVQKVRAELAALSQAKSRHQKP